MKTIVASLVALLASPAAAFVSQSAIAGSSTALAVSFEDELGAQKPLGYWDPLNFCYNVDQARFDRLRFVEIKHGRIAMLAVVGHMATTAGLRLPGNEAIPSGLQALQAIPQEKLLVNLAVAGALDVLIFQDKGKGEYPGDLRNGMFQWNASKQEKDTKRAIELNNGRAAQMGILALMYHETMTGEPYVINAFLGYPTV